MSRALTSRRHLLKQAGGLVLLLGAADLAFGAGIVAVRVWPADAYTRVTLESDQPLAARHQLLSDPERMVVDIEGLELSPQLRELVGKVRADDPFIGGIRVGQYQPRVVRLVIDLKQATAPQQFALAPVAAYQHRLVFDLYPTQPMDPLLALIRDKEASERDAAQTVQDALGEFIGKVGTPPPVAAAPVPPAAASAPGLPPPAAPPVVAAAPVPPPVT
ncbi:MAG: AMIN domain-containing protein, partial [Aquincola tertiaricarbonis]